MGFDVAMDDVSGVVQVVQAQGDLGDPAGELLLRNAVVRLGVVG